MVKANSLKEQYQGFFDKASSTPLIVSQYSAGQSLKFIATQSKPPEPATKGLNVFENIASVAIGRQPRSYNNERQAQNFRHLSTVFQGILEENGIDYREVQVGSNDKGLYVSTNMNAANDFLAGKIKELTGKKVTDGMPTLEEFINAHVLNIDDPANDQSLKEANESRQTRHGLKLASRAPTELASLLKYTINLPPNEDHNNDGKHAERRIAEQLKGGKNEMVIQGVKSPCAYCYHDLYENKNINIKKISLGPSAIWPTEASRRGLKIEDVSTESTHITLTRSGKPTLEYGTESDSDVTKSDLQKITDKRKVLRPHKRAHSPVKFADEES